MGAHESTICTNHDGGAQRAAAPSRPGLCQSWQEFVQAVYEVSRRCTNLHHSRAAELTAAHAARWQANSRGEPESFSFRIVSKLPDAKDGDSSRHPIVRSAT
jgi:hypothetical protein